MSIKFLHIPNIEQDLTEVQKKWASINGSLKIPRDDFSDVVKNNLLLTYDYVNFILTKLGRDSVFHRSNLGYLLEMNHLVLMGDNNRIREEYHKHIEYTREKFYSQMPSMRKWLKKKEKKGLYKQEAGIFVSGVSQPQLFIEGNHRTHSSIVNIMALQRGKNPFILNTKNALAFFDPAQEVKGSQKISFSQKMKLLQKKKIFEKFFKEHSSSRYKTDKIKKA